MSAAQNANARRILIFAALPFLGLSLAALLLAAYPVVQHLRALSWQATPATVLALDENSAPQRRIGDAHSSRIEGRFSYIWKTRNYQSEQIYFGSMYDNFDDDWKSRLRAMLGKEGQAISVWVNPADPSEAVATREIRWLEVGMALIGTFGFGLGGSALLATAGQARRKPKRPAGKVSWPLVLGLLASSPLWLTLSWLLWRDQHPLWAIASSLPVWLSLNGVRVGLGAFGLQPGTADPHPPSDTNAE